MYLHRTGIVFVHWDDEELHEFYSFKDLVRNSIDLPCRSIIEENSGSYQEYV